MRFAIRGLVTAALFSAMTLTGAAAPARSSALAGTATPAWLSEINLYRAAAGLAPVTDQPAWDLGIEDHLTYLADTPASYLTGPYASAHTENPASPYYTAAGAKEGASSDLFQGAVGFSDVNFIDGWLKAPFHAVGMLRPNLTQVAFASEPSTGDAGLDVISGLGQAPAATSPVLFPGPGMTTDLTSFGGELPDPTQSCAPAFQGTPVGLPLVMLLPNDPDPSLAATLTGPDGSVQSSANGGLCIVDDHTYHSTDPIYGPTGAAILQGDRAVFLIPATPLTWGRYQVSVSQPGQAAINWSFIAAPPGPVAGGKTFTLHVDDSGATTVLGNLTVVSPSGEGYTTAYPCLDGRPTASNNDYEAGEIVPNFVAVHPDSNGDVCLYTSQSTDLVWDQVAETTTFTSHNATRLLDTRVTQNRPAAGGVVMVHATSDGASTVLGNLTVVSPSAEGYTTAYPCLDGRPTASNNDYEAGEIVPNFVAVQPDSNGNICFYTSQSTDLVWDQVAETTTFASHDATRLLDTRAPQAFLG